MIIGMDPGQKGGIAYYHDGQFAAVPMPDTNKDLTDLMRKLLIESNRSAVCFIEKVGPSGQQGVKSAFTFGRSFERLVQVCSDYDVPVHEVLPDKWMAALNCRTGGNKKISKKKAQQLFPKMKVTDATADALLICVYGVHLSDKRKYA